MVLLVGLPHGVLVFVVLGAVLGMLQRLRLLASRLGELEAVGWKELEATGREYGLPGKLQAQGFHLALSAVGLFHAGGRLLVAVLLGNIPVSQSGGFWKLIR